MLIQIIVIAEIFLITYSQITAFTQSTATTLLQESSSCACDFVKGTCDEFCCCDSDCTGSLAGSVTIVFWDLTRKCSEKIYSTAYQIPECNREYQKSSSDLYLGLRIAYNLFKNLGCVTNQNTLATLQNKLIDSEDYTTRIENEITKVQTVTTQTTLSITNYMPSTIIATETYFKLYRPRSYSDTGCQQTSILQYKTYPVQICQRQLTKTQMDALLLTEFKYSSYTAGTLWGMTLTASENYYLITYGDSASTTRYQYKETKAPPSDPTATYQNLVVGVIYQLTMPEIPIDDTNVSTKPISITATFFVIDSVTTTGTTYNVPSINGIIYTTKKGEAYDISSKGGYVRGSPLRFKKSFTSTNEEVLQTMFLGLQSYQGECINTSQDISSSFEIRFLEDVKVSCLRQSTQGFPGSNIYTSIANNLQYVARYGDSGSNNLSTDEWLQITPCSSTDGMYQFSLQIGYIVFGEKGKERFRINSAQYTCAASLSIDQVNFEFRFYVQFVEIPNTWNHFKGPSPQLIGGLPDDILAPFINYG